MSIGPIQQRVCSGADVWVWIRPETEEYVFYSPVRSFYFKPAQITGMSKLRKPQSKSVWHVMPVELDYIFGVIHSPSSFWGPTRCTFSVSSLHALALSLTFSPFLKLYHLAYEGESYVGTRCKPKGLSFSVTPCCLTGKKINHHHLTFNRCRKCASLSWLYAWTDAWFLQTF